MQALKYLPKFNCRYAATSTQYATTSTQYATTSTQPFHCRDELIRPLPVAHLRHVVAVLLDIRMVVEELATHRLLDVVAAAQTAIRGEGAQVFHASKPVLAFLPDSMTPHLTNTRKYWLALVLVM